MNLMSAGAKAGIGPFIVLLIMATVVVIVLGIDEGRIPYGTEEEILQRKLNKEQKRWKRGGVAIIDGCWICVGMGHASHYWQMCEKTNNHIDPDDYVGYGGTKVPYMKMHPRINK